MTTTIDNYQPSAIERTAIRDCRAKYWRHHHNTRTSVLVVVTSTVMWLLLLRITVRVLRCGYRCTNIVCLLKMPLPVC